MKNYFKNNIKYLRKIYKLSQQDLGKKLNKDYSTIGKWELGERTPIMKDMVEISDFFNVPMDKLLFTDLAVDSNVDLDNEIIYKLNLLNENQKKVILDVMDNMCNTTKEDE